MRTSPARSEGSISRGRRPGWLRALAGLLCLVIFTACWPLGPAPPGAQNWPFSIGPQSYAVALGDLDGDGDLDAFVGNQRTADQVWLNAGGIQGGEPGTFIPGELVGGGEQTRYLELADLDGDGDLDAFVVYRDKATVWLNDGLANFSAGQQIAFEPQHGLALGDLNGNGHIDIFAGSIYQDILVWFNDGTGRFTRVGGGNDG